MKTSWNRSAPLLALNLGCACPAMAAGQAAATADAQSAAPADQVIQEVIVTSQRRATKVQDIPIAETVLTGDQLKDKAVVRLMDLQTASPALTIVDSGLAQSVNIRGIGLSSGSPNVANGMATYVDGLFQPPIVGSGSFYDIANVEVLRGPQGTLVGNSSTGGALLISSESPKLGAVEGYAEAGVGNYAAKTLQGAVNVPLSDTVALRVAVNHRGHDSFYTDHGPYHNTPGKLDEDAARVGLLFKQGPLQALFKFDYLNRKTGGAAGKPIPGSANDIGVTGGIYDLDYNSPTRYDEQARMSGLELKYETGSGIVLRSLSGYQDKTAGVAWDMDATTRLSNFMDQDVRQRTASQEFNIISPTTGRFNWILGAYFQQDKIDVGLLQTGGPLRVDVLSKTTKRVNGVFAQTGYKLTDDLEVQFGLRRSGFKSSGAGSVFVGRGAPGFPDNGLTVANLGGAYQDDKPTGKLALNWKADARNLLYVFGARGYKPGNYNTATTTFKPETVTNYEAGWKSTMAEGRIKTQLDVFYNKYKNFQLDVLDLVSGQNSPTNLQPSTSKGIEGQIQAKLSGFRIDAGFAYVDSKMGATSLVDTISLPSGSLGPQCAPGVASNPPICFEYGPYLYSSQGGPNLYSPKITYNVGVDYKFDFDNGSSLTPRLNVSHIGESYFYATYRPNAYLPARTVWSGLVTWRHDDWSAELFGNNLTDKHYIVGSAQNNLYYSAPREFGVRVRRDF